MSCQSIANKYLRPGGDPPRAGGGVSGGYGDRPGGGRPGARDFDADNRDHRAGGRFDGRGDRDSRPPRNDGPGDLSTVSQAVRQKIDLLISRFSRYLNRGHFDSGVINALKQIGDEGALQVLDEIASNDLGNVRNPPGYMMGIISRYLRGDRQQRGGGGQV